MHWASGNLLLGENPDDGCVFWAECLTCPFTECIYDTPMDRQLRWAFIVRVHKLFDTGQYENAEHLADVLNVHVSTIKQALRKRKYLTRFEPFEQTAKVFE